MNISYSVCVCVFYLELSHSKSHLQWANRLLGVSRRGENHRMSTALCRVPNPESINEEPSVAGGFTCGVKKSHFRKNAMTCFHAKLCVAFSPQRGPFSIRHRLFSHKERPSGSTKTLHIKCTCMFFPKLTGCIIASFPILPVRDCSCDHALDPPTCRTCGSLKVAHL